MVLDNGRKVEMSLNIKSEQAHRLARELAQLTGESMTAAVEKAVEREAGAGPRQIEGGQWRRSC